MPEYRILYNGYHYKVQKKVLWIFWFDETEDYFDALFTRTFTTYKKAHQYVLDQTAAWVEWHTPYVVVSPDRTPQ